MTSNESESADTFIRNNIAERCGGASFDKGGSYVFSEMLKSERKLAKTSVPGEPSTAVLAFSVADPVWKMDEEAFESGCEFYRYSDDSTRYTDLAGIRDIKIEDEDCIDTQEALAILVNRGTNLTIDNVQYSPGAIKRALSEYIPAAFFDEDTILLLPDPSYGVIGDPMNCRCARVIKIPLHTKGLIYDLDYNKIITTIEAIRTQDRRNYPRKIMMYVNIPHNPTGFGYNKKQWKHLLDLAAKYNILLIVDEAYVDIAYSPDIISVIEVDGWQNNCIVIQSISKAYNATGARFGWLLGHPTAIKVLRKVMDCKDSGMFAPIIASALHCLENKDLAKATRERYKNIHQKLSSFLCECGLKTVCPDAGLCQLSDYPKKANDGTRFGSPSEFADWLRQKYKISVMPQDAIGKIRWAVTFRPQPEFLLNTEQDVLEELKRRLIQAFG